MNAGLAARISLPEWSVLLSVGNDVIDGEHRAFLHQVGHAVILIEQSDIPEIKTAIVTLVKCLKAHFESEERIFNRTAYPGAMSHATEHHVLYHMAFSLREQVEESDDLTYVALSLRYLAQLVVEHLVETDMGYRPYLAEVA